MTPLDLTMYPGDDDGGDGPTVVAVGEIDLSNIERFSNVLADAAGARNGGPAARVIVDLRAVDYLDSGALGVLFGHAEAIRVIAGPLLLPVLTVSGLTSVVAVGVDAP